MIEQKCISKRNCASEKLHRNSAPSKKISSLLKRNPGLLGTLQFCNTFSASWPLPGLPSFREEETPTGITPDPPSLHPNNEQALLTLASWSKRPKSSLSSLTSSCAEHCDDSTVKPTMSAKRMLQRRDRGVLGGLHILCHGGVSRLSRFDRGS